MRWSTSWVGKSGQIWFWGWTQTLAKGFSLHPLNKNDTKEIWNQWSFLGYPFYLYQFHAAPMFLWRSWVMVEFHILSSMMVASLSHWDKFKVSMFQQTKVGGTLGMVGRSVSNLIIGTPSRNVWWSAELFWHFFNGHFRNPENWRYRFHIFFGLFFRPICNREYPRKSYSPKNGTFTYLHVLDPEDLPLLKK